MTTLPSQQPVLTDVQLQEIQGFGIAGFRKDHQEVLFIRMQSPNAGKALLSKLAPLVANAWEVTTFNNLFKEVKGRTGEEPLAVVWTAIMISAAGFTALGQSTSELTVTSPAFLAGMPARATQIGDVQASDAPTQWLAPFQPNANQVHFCVVVAADEEDDLAERVLKINNMASEFGCEIVFQERGGTLPPPFVGHEHFGFADGISQPVILGYGDQPGVGEPPPVAIGEIVLGFPDNGGTTVAAGTNWENGSFVVFRRLRQNVAAFRTFIAAGIQGANPALVGDAFAATLMGRWQDGAPLETFPNVDPGPGFDINNFSFATDQIGANCPAFAHIRKANPRDTLGLAGTPDDPSEHRMLRRGIPYGELLAPGASDDGKERGLHFFCVVADLERQFEFVQSNWLNNPNFPLGTQPQVPGPYSPPSGGTPPNGPDPIVGEHDGNALCVLEQASGTRSVPLSTEFVNVTAGEYFFLPSISAILSFAT